MNKATEGILNDIDMSSGLTDRQRRTMVQMQRLRPLVRRQDYYSILGVSRTATQREIITAYRELARTVAPDKNPGMDTTEIFQAVNRAYEVLSDESKRREYDLGGQREEYDDDEDLGRGDETFSADLVNTLTAGVKPSESFRVLFEKELNRNVKWQAPSQSLENWIQTIVKNINSTVDTLISPHQSSVGSPDYLCPICAAIICKQKDPALLLLEEKHMKNNHNAYLARIESIRKSLKNPTSIEQVLYCDTIPFPVPVKSSLTLTSVQEGIAPPALLREIAKEFRSESNTSLLGNGWAGYAEWRQLLSFLEDISLRKGLLSLDLVESQLRTAMNDNLLPLGKKSEIPAAEYQVGTSVPILRKEGLHPSLQAVLDIPTVKTKRIPSSWQSSRSCSYCGSWVIFFSRSHCRVCGNTICSSCVRSRTLPSYGLTATRHTVCPTCYSQSYSSLWKSLAFESNAIRSVISGVIGISFLHPSDKRDLSQFSFTNSLDYLRVAFLCKQVPPITETEKSIVYRQREAWLRYATSSLNSAVRLYRSNSNSLLTPAAATHRKNIRVALMIARLLASVPSDRAEQCWDESRNSLMNSSEDGAYLLCLLMEKQGNWKDVGNIFLQQKLLLPALFCFKIHDENFNESEFFLQLAAKQTSPADVIFFTAAATLMDETASNVIQLATEAKKAGEVKWAVEILCAGWDKWKDSSKKARGHALLIECFEALNLPEISTVLMAGYELLCEIAEGARLQQYKTKLRDLQSQHVSSNSNEERGKDILRNLRYQLCLGSSELFAPLLLKAFQERDEEELEQIIAHQRRSFATADRSKLPAPVRSNLLLPEAVLDIIKGHYPEGVRKLMDALLLSISAGLDDYIKLATDILFEVEVRAGCLKVLSDEMKGIHTVEGLLRSSFLKDVEPAYSNVTNSDFQFARVLRNSAELRVMRMFERAIDGVEARDGSFEAAMSCLDAATICVGQSSRLKMLLKATHHFYRASIQKKNNKTNNTLAYNYACLFVGICIMHVASGIINKLSPVLQGYFLRQLLSQQILFLQKIYTLNNNKVPEDIEELLLTTTENTFKRLISIQGGFPTLWCRVQGRAFDDIISEMIYDKLSSAGIYKLELNLKGLITTEQWIYWRFEGVWNSWLNNPYNDVITAADEERRKIKEQQAMERKLREEEETAEEKVKEEKEETIYAKNRIRQMNQNAKKFFDEEREDAMIRYLNEKKWRWEDISKLINCMSVPRTVDGFIDPQKGLTPRNDFLFSSFDGFEVDRASGTVKFLLTESRRSGKPALFGWREIREIFNVGLPAMIFSLDAIDPQRQHHPFQLLHFNSEKARGTTVLSCMFHTDYILKFLSCGLEVSCLPPFKQRDVREGFLRRLPSYVQEDLSVIWSNQASNRSNDDQAHRFWIDAGDLAYSDTRDQNSYRVVYGKQMMRVKKHKLRLNANGELVDDDGPDSLEDREYQFAANFTRHYDLIASYFPEFAMLGEFSKMISATVLLLCEAMNCKEIIKDITNNKTTVANQIESQLRNDLGSIDFPLAGSNKLNTMIEEHIQEQERIHHIRLTIQQRNQIRDEYQRQAREADNKQVNSLASSLGVSNSNSVRTMLITKNFTSIARELSESGAKDAMKKFETILSALRKEGLPVDGDITENMKQKMKGEWVTSPAVDFPCEWVPAVFRTGNYRGDMEEEDGPAGSYRVYGGVCLQSHLMKQVVNPPSTSQFFASPSTLSAQRAVSAPFSTAAKIDNQHRATQEFFQRQSQVLQQINAQRAANQRQQMINSFTNQQHSNATMNSGQVRRYMSHPQGAAGAYWTPDHFQSRSDARNRLAVLPEWNTMKYMAVSSIPRNTQVYSGSAAPQGAYSGGATQYVVPNRWSQREMADNARIYKHEWTPRFFETWNQVK